MGGASRDHFPRSALAERARDGLGRGALVVTAPAGYGKTTLLEQALALRRPRVAWVRCTRRERHPVRLVESLCSAIGRAPAGGGDPDAVRDLVTELDNSLDRPLAVVLDDAEHLAGASGSCGVVAEMLRHPGDCVEVAVLSRSPLDLPLSKPRAAGRLGELGVADMAFTTPECAEYLARVRGAPATTAEVDEIMRATEGWPLAVATVVRAGGLRVGGRGSALPAAELRAFLSEELLDGFAGAARRDLLDSAVPRFLSPAIASALGLPGGFLEGILAGGLDLRVVDRPRGLVAYHPRFREVLLERLGTESPGPGHLRRLNRRVAPAVAAAGHPADAIEHWIAARDWKSATAAIQAETARLDSTPPGVLAGWLDRLPGGVRASPAGLALDGQLAWLRGNHGPAAELLGAVLDGGAGHADAGVGWRCRFLLTDCLMLQGRFDEGARLGQGFTTAAARRAGAVAVAAGLGAAACMAAAGRIEDAERHAALARRAAPEAEVAPLDAVIRALVDVPAGRLDEALDRALAAWRFLEQADPLAQRFTLAATLATVLAEQGRIDDALGWWRRAAGEAGPAGRARAARGFAALLLARSGRATEAQSLLAGWEPADSWVDAAAYAARCLVADASADRGRVTGPAALAVASARAAPPPHQVTLLLAVVGPLVRAGALARAEAAVGEASALVERNHPGPAGAYLRARVLAAQAFLHSERNDPGPATDTFVRAVHEAGPAAAHLLRAEWEGAGALVGPALAAGPLDPSAVVRWLAEAFPDGRALVALTGHPRPEVRRASFRPALSSGNARAAAGVTRAFGDADPSVAAAARAAIAGVAYAPPPRVYSTLGGFAVRKGGWCIEERDWPRPVDARLVRFLLVTAGPVAEDILFEAFWPHLPPERARRSLQVAASRVRALLDHPGPGPSVVEAAHGCYRLRIADADVVDFQEFERAARLALATGHDLRVLEWARSLWGGEPLPRERYSDWAASWRGRLVERYLAVLVALVAAYEREGDHCGAVGTAREMVGLDPLDESAHRALMTSLARAGRRGQALEQFRECRQALATDLGVEPAPETSALQARILAGVEV